MTKGEIQTIRNIIRRLKQPNCGCANAFRLEALVKEVNSHGVEAVSRVYLDSWVIPALEYLLPENRDVDLAERLSA